MNEHNNTGQPCVVCGEMCNKPTPPRYEVCCFECVARNSGEWRVYHTPDIGEFITTPYSVLQVQPRLNAVIIGDCNPVNPIHFEIGLFPYRSEITVPSPELSNVPEPSTNRDERIIATEIEGMEIYVAPDGIIVTAADPQLIGRRLSDVVEESRIVDSTDTDVFDGIRDLCQPDPIETRETTIEEVEARIDEVLAENTESQGEVLGAPTDLGISANQFRRMWQETDE